MASTNFAGGVIHAQVDDFETRAPKHHDHDVLADVVDIVLYGAEYGRGLRLGLLDRAELGTELGHDPLHNHPAEHQVGQEALLAVEAVAQLDHPLVALRQDLGGRHSGIEFLAARDP